MLWVLEKITSSFIVVLFVCFSFLERSSQRNIAERLHKPESPHLFLLGDRFLLTPSISKQQFGLALAGFIAASRIVLRHILCILFFLFVTHPKHPLFSTDSVAH